MLVTLKAKTGTLSKAEVEFRSVGGSIVAGIKIGEAIRIKGFSTLVEEGCASACALAWLGGIPRYATAQARIGFHAAYNAQSGEETGVGNALVGAYLNNCGFATKIV